MHRTEILQLIVRSLGLTHERVAEIIARGGATVTPAEVDAWMGGSECSEEILTLFLDGLIVERRGPGPPAPAGQITNNLVLKKLRIALSLHEAEVLGVLEAGGMQVTSRELTPLFRKPDNKHFRACTDDVLRAFLSGLGGSA